MDTFRWCWRAVRAIYGVLIQIDRKEAHHISDAEDLHINDLFTAASAITNVSGDKPRYTLVVEFNVSLCYNLKMTYIPSTTLRLF